MQRIFKILILTMFLISSTFTTTFSQIPWTKDPDNPLSLNGATGEWNRHVVYPCVLYNADSSRYEMWYTATSGPVNNEWRPHRIGFATSIDGISWTNHPNPVLEPDLGSWDAETVEGQAVIRENDGTYKMWYIGWADPNDPGGIGFATSFDGIHWTKDTFNNPVITPNGNPWDVGGYGVCNVLPYTGGYKMWYDGWNAGWTVATVGYAISTNGINWTAYSDNPVLTTGSTGSWDAETVGSPTVLFLNGLYQMWFEGSSPNGSPPKHIGWATSIDGINWRKYNDQNTTTALFVESDPVLYPNPGQWDGTYVDGPSVMLEGDSLRMWYNGSIVPTSTKLWRIGHATARFTLQVTRHVPADYPTIQAAIVSATEGNLILVADGTYQENINFKGKAITVASHFYIDNDTSHISNTIIDGSNPSNADSGSVVSFVSGEDTTSVLYGFTIKGGTGTISNDGTNAFRSGGGIFCYNSGARVSHNKITQNDVPQHNLSAGGGIGSNPEGSAAHLIIEDNEIINNSVTGTEAYASAIDLSCNGIIDNNDIRYNSCIATDGAIGAVECWTETNSQPRTVVVKNNRITNNTSSGNFAIAGGLSIEGNMSATVTGNDISLNTLNNNNSGFGGAGIYVWWNNGISLLDKNYIYGNSSSNAHGGGIHLVNSNISITNNIISNNSAPDGGGIYSTNSNAEIINNTIVNNIANQGAGIMTDGTNHPVVLNTIVWGNQNQQVVGNPIIHFSDIQDTLWTSGTGNLSIDPKFVTDDSLYNLMHTTDTSRCLNAGTDSIQINGTWYFVPDHDYAGSPRPLPGGFPPDYPPDMGAWEYDVISSLEEIEELSYPKSFALKQNYPNPFNPITNIEFSLPKAELVSLKIYSLLGQEVITLVSKKLNGGSYKYSWDASSLASGVYLYELKAGNFVETRKMLLLR